MILGVPLPLILVYAVYRLVEYLAIKRLQMPPWAAPMMGQVAIPLALGILLWPTRIFGWGFLLYYGYYYGWLEPVKLLPMAFILSLGIQGLAQMRSSFEQLIIVGSLASFVVLPTCAILMFVFLPTR